MRTWRDRRIIAEPLSKRAQNALLTNHCVTAGDVAKMTPAAIGRLPNVGHRTAIEIIFWLIAIFIDDEFGMGARLG